MVYTLSTTWNVFFFSSWYTQSTKTTSGERDAEAKANIRQYYAWVINGVTRIELILSWIKDYNVKIFHNLHYKCELVCQKLIQKKFWRFSFYTCDKYKVEIWLLLISDTEKIHVNLFVFLVKLLITINIKSINIIFRH